jgi:hypothetical protein
MRICRSVSDGVHATGADSIGRTEETYRSDLMAGDGVAAILTCPILASRGTYGQVFRLFDNGHCFGAALLWQQDGWDESRNGQLISANPEAKPRSANATQQAIATRTCSE